MVADHLFRPIVERQVFPIDDAFPNEHLVAVALDVARWFANIANHLACEVLPFSLTNVLS